MQLSLSWDSSAKHCNMLVFVSFALQLVIEMSSLEKVWLLDLSGLP